ncbi:MAG: quinone oxidoreductase [Ornithinimicrobium sp.]
MRSVIVAEHGGPEVLLLREGERPEPGVGEVLVRVAAGGVNFIDIYQRSGAYPMSLPYVVGSEAAGTVQSVGTEVTSLAVGDRVAWADVPGSGACEYAVVPEQRAVPVPAGVDLRDAAAVMLQGMTAHYLCESAFQARDGQVALVHAASGGVGLLLCQMLAAKGVHVIGTTSTEAKERLAREAGAADVVRYRSVDESASAGVPRGLVEQVRALTNGAGVDVVYDGVGKATFDDGLTLLKPRGTMVLFGAASGPVPPIDPQALNAAGSVFLTRPKLGDYLRDRDELMWRAGDVLTAVGDGMLSVRIGGTYPLADLAEAHRDLASGGTSGKLLVLP